MYDKVGQKRSASQTLQDEESITEAIDSTPRNLELFSYCLGLDVEIVRKIRYEFHMIYIFCSMCGLIADSDLGNMYNSLASVTISGKC